MLCLGNRSKSPIYRLAIGCISLEYLDLNPEPRSQITDSGTSCQSVRSVYSRSLIRATALRAVLYNVNHTPTAFNMSCSAVLPFQEPPWLQGLPSPYYRDTHRRYQQYCRTFVDKHLNEHALEWEEEGLVPEHVFQTFGRANMLVPNLPSPLPIEQLRNAGIEQIGTGDGAVKIEDWDYIHTMIHCTEVS